MQGRQHPVVAAVPRRVHHHCIVSAMEPLDHVLRLTTERPRRQPVEPQVVLRHLDRVTPILHARHFVVRREPTGQGAHAAVKFQDAAALSRLGAGVGEKLLGLGGVDLEEGRGAEGQGPISQLLSDEPITQQGLGVGAQDDVAGAGVVIQRQRGGVSLRPQRHQSTDPLCGELAVDDEGQQRFLSAKPGTHNEVAQLALVRPFIISAKGEVRQAVQQGAIKRVQRAGIDRAVADPFQAVGPGAVEPRDDPALEGLNREGSLVAVAPGLR